MSDLDPVQVAADFRRRYLQLKGQAGGFPDEGEPLFIDYARHHPALADSSETRVRQVWAKAWAAACRVLPTAVELESAKAISTTMLDRAGGNPAVQFAT